MTEQHLAIIGLFYPSLIIFAGSLVMMAFREEDRLVLDARKRPRPASHGRKDLAHGHIVSPDCLEAGS